MSNEKLYIKGFNRGYDLQRCNPDLAKVMIDGWQSDETEFSMGFKDGVQEYINELRRFMDQNIQMQRESLLDNNDLKKLNDRSTDKGMER